MANLDLSSFPKPDKNNWLNVAEKQLKGDDPFTNLAWESNGLSHLKPYYDAEDIQDLDQISSFFKGLPTHHWKLYERIRVEDEKIANQEALNALQGGCDGIIFETDHDFNSESLLDNIDYTICDISIPIASESSKIQGMNAANCLVQNNLDLNAADQIISLIKALEKSTAWVSRTAFADFFVEIASIRALRFVLNSDFTGSAIRIHTSIPTHASDEHQWFLNTTACLASILGGTYSLDMPTSAGDTRISRNVGNIIREETGIETYEDQCGGSYLVESLTSQIIQQVQSNLK